MIAAVGSAHPRNHRASLTHIKPKILPSYHAQDCSAGLGMCSAASPIFQTSQPDMGHPAPHRPWGARKWSATGRFVWWEEYCWSAGQRCGNLHLPLSVPVNLLCRQRLNQPSVTPVLCQLSCSCRGAKGKFTIANPLLTHLFMPLAPPESQLAWVLEYFLHPAVLQSSHAGEFFHYHFTCALRPLCSTLLCVFCIHSVYIGHWLQGQFLGFHFQ